MYVIEAGEEVTYFSIKFIISLIWSETALKFILSLTLSETALFQVTINYLPMAEEGGEVREVRQKYLRY